MKNIYQFLYLHGDDISNILECGSHLGTDTKQLSDVCKNAVIYCLEANPELYQILLDKFKNIDTIQIFNNALASKTQKLKFFVDKNPCGDSGASSLLESNEFYLRHYIKKEDTIEVDSLSLDDFMTINQIDYIDLLWLDIEGYEYYVLESSKKLSNVHYIYTEVNFQEFRKNSKTYNDIKELLLKYNFKELYKWEQGAEWGKWQGNVLFQNIDYKVENFK